MSQRVVNNQIALGHQMSDHRLVGRVTAGESDYIFDADKFREFFFQRFVNRFLTGNQAACRDTGTKLVDRLFGHLVDLGVSGKSEVVVAGKRNQLTTVNSSRIANSPFVHAEIRVTESRLFELVASML